MDTPTIGVIASVACGIALMITTQIAACRLHVRFGNAAIVGPPTIAIAHRIPVYSPVRLILWARIARHVPAVRQVLQTSAVGGVAIFLSVLTGGMAFRARRHRPRTSMSHGSARWGDGRDLRGPDGVLLGRLDGQMLRYHGEGHLVTVAPTRSGKGVSVLIPNLLTYPGSVVVSDPKGENYAVTARYRHDIGTAVAALDPFDVVGGTATYNPLDLIDPTQIDAVDDARLVAEMLVVTDGKDLGEGAFWNEEARALLTGLILHVVSNTNATHRTLARLRGLLTLPPTSFTELLREMSSSHAAHGLVARAAARLLQKAEKERSGVISSAQSHTHFLDSPRMTRVLSHSTIDLTVLKQGRMSLYCILPPNRMDSYHRWLRLMIACCLTTITRIPGKPAHRILFLLDEFAHLGKMQPVARDISLVGGYGASFWLFLQDLSQLRSIYPEQWRSFLANADVLQAFSTNDWDTAEYLSKMTGDATIEVESSNHSQGVSRGRHGTRQEGTGITRAERGRRLVLPDEVRQMHEQLLFVKRSAPIRADRLNYLHEPEWQQRYDRNPFFEAV